MDSSSPPQPKNQRRKRKDPESRDFVCKCGKSYLSYAAAYTHVKNKHDGDKQFLENISKPERQRLKRGRPKERRQVQINSQTQLLSIIQQTILQIFQSCKKEEEGHGPSKIVLEGNQQLKVDEVFREYDTLEKKRGETGIINIFNSKQKYGQTGKIILKFVDSLNKHFLPPIAAKINYSINYLLNTCCVEVPIQAQKENQKIFELEIDYSKVRTLKEEAHLVSMWQGKDDVIGYITDAFEKWIESNDKLHNND